MKHVAVLAGLVALLAIATFAQEPPPKPKGPPPAGGRGGPGGPSQESPEMQKLLTSFNLTTAQRARYDAARVATSKKMREIHEGKVSGALAQNQVLKQALESHKAFNATVKEILSAEQFAVWEPLREADHHKIAKAHKERGAAEKPDGPAK
jgi:hypothetical protein